jgi:hypothetical protein
MQLQALSRINFRSGFGDPSLFNRLENTFNVSLIGSAVPLKRIPVELIYLGVKIAGRERPPKTGTRHPPQRVGSILRKRRSGRPGGSCGSW